MARSSTSDAHSVSVAESTRDKLVELITKHDLRPGDKLPSERDLAQTFDVSRNTVREALGMLVRSGYVLRRPGRGGGTFVNQPKVERDLTILTGLPGHLHRQGRQSSAQVLSARLIQADSWTAKQLQIAPDELVYELVRLRLSDGEPLSLERSRFPATRFAGLLDYPLAGSIYEILRNDYKVPPKGAQERIEPTVASSTESVILGVKEGAPLLLVERVTYDADGTPVEVGSDVFRGDRTRVVVWVESPEVSSVEVRKSASADSKHRTSQAVER
ncbi:GntR family transcriptional regulator [Mycolicibacterium sp. BiH015]|uniref:GntR family transcriptional regulator n=1 Tax=Mycolicibacterium sp. BiH015 TaxID=3018808 RepID=UPI0022DF00F1|nr:GntR family transcriptional regulator [Mycolicibacterium sp. BiH015]MDA2893329.1 GntR family transcriptional regulator [Mycolicibacterium sp. BiH015]